MQHIRKAVEDMEYKLNTAQRKRIEKMRTILKSCLDGNLKKYKLSMTDLQEAIRVYNRLIKPVEHEDITVYGNVADLYRKNGFTVFEPEGCSISYKICILPEEKQREYMQSLVIETS